MGTVETTMAPVTNLVDMVDRAELELPEIQRGYVWNRPQVRDLLDSLYRGYPIGTVLIWQTESAPIARPLEAGAGQNALDAAKFLLDGQQRLTSLTRVFRPQENSPDIRFNIETEEFQVANAVIKRDTSWVSVSDVFTKGAITVAMDRDLLQRKDAKAVLERLSRLEAIKSYQVPVHVLKNFDYEEVTEIFVRVNSRGTRLREAELAIARLAFRLPGIVTEEMKTFEEELDASGYDIDLRFLVRCLTAVATGQSRFGPLASVREEDIRRSWTRTRSAVQYLLNLLKNNLGIETADWLPSRNAIVVPVAYLARTRHQDVDAKGLMRWFLLASTWQRYAGSAETALDQDLRALVEPEPFRLLSQQILQGIGRTEVLPEDLDDAGTQSPFFLVAYLACRRNGAVDWWTGVKLNSTNLGMDHALEIHHVFPRALVSERYPRRDVNEIANMAFLSLKANRDIWMSEPSEYLPKIPEDRLRQQFIPMDPELWHIDRFQDFLAERRRLLAEGIQAVFRDLE
jgi:hypothetical protein